MFFSSSLARYMLRRNCTGSRTHPSFCCPNCSDEGIVRISSSLTLWNLKAGLSRVQARRIKHIYSTCKERYSYRPSERIPSNQTRRRTLLNRSSWHQRTIFSLKYYKHYIKPSFQAHMKLPPRDSTGQYLLRRASQGLENINFSSPETCAERLKKWFKKYVCLFIVFYIQNSSHEIYHKFQIFRQGMKHEHRMSFVLHN